MPSCGVCPPVRHGHVFSWNELTHLQNFFHYWVATPFCFFRTKPYGNIPMGTPDEGIECRCARQKWRFSANMSSSHAVVASWWHSSLVNGFVCCSQEMTTKCLWQEASTFCKDSRTAFTVIVCSGKSEAQVTSNKRVRSRYCPLEATCWQTRSIARPLLSWIW